MTNKSGFIKIGGPSVYLEAAFNQGNVVLDATL